MIAEIISVGTELLLGETIDTDAAYVAQALATLGINIYHRQTVGDNPARLRDVLEQALGRAQVVITIGGLGPTQDDLTKETVADVLYSVLQPDLEHVAWLKALAERRNWPHPVETFTKQAMIPENGSGIPNPNGTALGAIFESGAHAVICLPGPPSELVPMVDAHVIPYLANRTTGNPQVIHSRTLKVVGVPESMLEDRVRDLIAGTNPTVAPYAKPAEVHLRVTARAATIADADALIRPVTAELTRRIGDSLYGADADTLESVVVDQLRRTGKKLAAAESCSGGLIAKRITDVPDASDVFDLGIVAYANEAKTTQLGVPADLIAAHGAVSPEVACAMAEGIRRVGRADFGVSVTGIAGPAGGTVQKPVGTVHVGLAWDGGVTSELYQFLGSRSDVALRASQAALDIVRLYLIHGEAVQRP